MITEEPLRENAPVLQRRNTGEIFSMSEPLTASLTAAIRGLMPNV
jgi:hypothetical protein